MVQHTTGGAFRGPRSGPGRSGPGAGYRLFSTHGWQGDSVVSCSVCCMKDQGHDRSLWSEEAVSGRHAVPGIDHGCRVGFCIGNLA